MTEDKLWTYFRELNEAVQAASKGEISQPFRRGQFSVLAMAGEIELALKDISEEDAILIASELKAMGVETRIQANE